MSQEVTAPLSGKIVSVNVQVGESVEEDQDIIVIETMKMETLVYAPCDGTVREIRVKAGDAVSEDDMLAVIDES